MQDQRVPMCQKSIRRGYPPEGVYNTLDEEWLRELEFIRREGSEIMLSLSTAT